MACMICQHCHDRLNEEDVVVQKGCSYHNKCHKCYVCSETNLQNAEVFKGVIFCSGCSQRIFQGCSTVRRSKNGARAVPSRATKRGRRKMMQDKRNRTRPRQGRVLETTRKTMITDSNITLSKKNNKDSDVSSSVLRPTEQELYEDSSKNMNMKTDSKEIGVTTDVTQELLRQMECPIAENPNIRKKEIEPPPIVEILTKEKGDNRYNKPKICSDLRMAELGASTEIAHLALRQKSAVPVIMRTNAPIKSMESSSGTVTKQQSDISTDGKERSASNYSDKEPKYMSWLDRKLGSIIKMPYEFFKRNILERSSLISVVMSNSGDGGIFIDKMKTLFHQEIAQHQERGIRRLYSTINRRKKPYKLGWMNLMASMSERVKSERKKRPHKQYANRCKHFQRSHSYRCMRAQVMRLAGPTKSELASYRSLVKKALSPPNFIKYVLGYEKRNQAIRMSRACGGSQI